MSPVSSLLPSSTTSTESACSRALITTLAIVRSTLYDGIPTTIFSAPCSRPYFDKSHLNVNTEPVHHRERKRMTRTRTALKPSIPRKKWLPPEIWNRVLKAMPIPCVDIIFQRLDNTILYGWRLLAPYRRVWALIGGRIVRDENLVQCASRIANEYGLGFGELYLNGVFPIDFSNRSDISISVAARKLSGEPQVDGFEFSKFIWATAPPRKLGTNYARMIAKWRAASGSRAFLRSARLL